MGLFSGPATGLFKSPNPFSVAPAGSLAVADDVVFSSPSVLEPRRGMSVLANSTFGSPGSVGNSLAFHGTDLLLAYDKTKIALKPDSSTFTDFTGTFVPPSTNRMRFVGAARSIFFNTVRGMYDYDGLGQPYLAGNPQGLSIVAQNNSANGWQAPNTAVAYRFTICSKDAFGRIIEGPPTGRTVLRNIVSAGHASIFHDAGSGVVQVQVGHNSPHYLSVGDMITVNPADVLFPAGPWPVTAIGDPYQFEYTDDLSPGGGYGSMVAREFDITRSVDLTLYFPHGTTGQPVTTNSFLRVYRSDMTFLASDTPFDDMRQCYESGYLSALDVSRGYLSFNDVCPEEALGAPLYTSPNIGDGILSSRFAPPVCRDMTYFANRMWLANTYAKHSAQLALIGTGTPDGVQAGDGLVIHLASGDLTFIGSATNPILATPINDTFVDAATGGHLPAATYSYRVTALDAGGGETLGSAETDIMVVTGGVIHTVTVNWFAVPGATGYKVYGRTSGSELLIATVGAVTTYVDDGSITPAGALPIANTTGDQFFEVFTDGDPGFNIARTAQALVFAINTSKFNHEVYAFYLSTETGIPGQMLIVAREFGDAHSFTLFQGSAHGSAWNPQLPDQFAPAFDPPKSDNNKHPAGLYYSALGLPEGIPLLNFQGTGAANLAQTVDADNDEILRIFPLHYRLIIFKTNGIYFCTNVAPFTVQKLSDYKLIAPDSLALLEDRLYCLTDQGEVVITDSGVSQLSIPIDDDIRELGGPVSLSFLKTEAFGISYRSARQYLCWMIDRHLNEAGVPDFSTVNTQAFVYSTLSGGFTRFTFGAKAAVVDPNKDVLIVAPSGDNRLWAENKSLTLDDYTDLSSSADVATSSGSTLSLFVHSTSTPLTGLLPGDVLRHGGVPFIITDVDDVAGTVTVLGEPGWAPGTAIDTLAGISTEVVFNKLTSGSPAMMKMVDQCSFLFRSNSLYETSAVFSTEINQEPVAVELFNEAWGEFPWGEVPYGCPTQQLRRVQPLPAEVENAAQLSVGFRTRQALASFEFLGIDVVSRPDTEANRG